MKDFVSLKRLREYIKLYEAQADEAAGDEMDDIQDIEGAGDMDAPEPDPTSADDNDAPEEQANPEHGVFISDIKKAEFAKLLISAFMADSPQVGTVPDNMLNVNVDNSQQVIDFVQNALTLNITDTNNETNEDGFANAVKEV